MVYTYQNGISRKRIGKIGLMSIALLFSFTMLLGVFKPTNAAVNAVTPSTNEVNRSNGWAYVDQTNIGIGTTDLKFISTRGFYSCFEYRADGDTSQVISENGGVNYNPGATGLYPYVCENNSSETVTIHANQYVEVRMVFGAEGDERFDWTRFDVLYNRTAEITAPSVGQKVYGEVNFSAYLDDKDADSIQWAVRQGTCAAGTNTVFGNVDGFNNVATINTSNLSMQTFQFTGDLSAMTPGMYCFIYNPVEDAGEANIRKTVEFNLLAPLTDKNVCKQGGWANYDIFKNQGDCVSYIATNSRNLPALEQ